MRAEGIYHRSPYPIRVGMASARGVLLTARRYGRDHEDLVAQALEREHWTTTDWRAWQDNQVDRLLRTARARVPAYRSLPSADGAGVQGLAHLPLLAKEQLRQTPGSFLRDDAPSSLITEHTSGSTGTPLTLQISREDYRRWYALAEARWRSWYGVSRHDRWAIVGGQAVVSPATTTPPYWVWNAAMHQLYLSSYHIADTTAAAYVQAMDHHRVTYLLGYPSAIHALAVACQRQGVRPRPLRVVVANAEPVLEHQRAAIGEVFGCPVRETYGMAEYVAAGSECEHGTMHLWPEAGVLEVVGQTNADPVPPGATGRFVATGLINTTMPLIRYLVGDSGSVAPAANACTCGRSLPILAGVEGRSDDLIRTADGRLIGRLDPVFKEDLPIRGAQIIQEELGRFRVVVVPGDGYGPDAEHAISTRLRDRVGDVRITFELVEALPLGPNGKFKAVVSHVPTEG